MKTTTLELILNAAASLANDRRKYNPVSSKFPILLDPVDVFPNLKPEEPISSDPSHVHPISGWEISASDLATMESVKSLSAKLTEQLKATKYATKNGVLKIINAFPIKKFGSLVSNNVIELVIGSCVVFELWEKLEELIVTGIVHGGTDLVDKLVEKSKVELLCVYAKNVPDLRSSDLVSLLGFFLSPTKETYKGMVLVKKEWERQCLNAIEISKQKDTTNKTLLLAREAAILLMMACDGFSPSESCLHHLFSSVNLEGLIISDAVSKLGNEAVLRLVRYFRKWIEKYVRFPEAVPCSDAASLLGLRACEFVPSLESVLKGLGLVLDQHFTHMVINNELQEEMLLLDGSVRSLVADTNTCCYLASVIKNLPVADGIHR